MSEENTIKDFMQSGSSRALRKRKRKISENDLQNGINSMIIPNESKYWMRSTKADSHTATVPKKSRKQASKNAKEVKPPEPNMLLTDLPNEILGKCFSYLSFDDLFRMERVNKRLRAVVTSYTWKQKHVLDHESIVYNTEYPKISLAEERTFFRFNQRKNYFKRHNITNKSIKMIFSRATIRALDLSIYHTTLSYQVSSIMNMVPQLSVLNLSFIRLTNNSLRSIARYCPLLEEVSFEQCFCDGKVEQGLEVLFTTCSNIKYLNLGENNKLYGDSFAYIPSGLLYLNLANCYNVNTNAIGALAESAKNLETLILENYDNAAVSRFNAWLGKLTKLKYLEVSNIFMAENYPKLDFSSFQELEMLCLRYNTLVSNDSLRTLQYCPKLKSIDLRFGNQFDNSTLDVLKKCKNLQYCNFSNWGQFVADFAKHLKLKYLAINDCKEIKEDTVQKLLTECAFLRYVELLGLSIDYHKSLRYVELLGLSIDYHKVLSNSFKQPCPHRSSILNLVAPRANPISYLNTCKWVNVIPSEPYGMSPFGRFTSIRDQYPHKKQ
uniref:F-box domain-containing protein n=1 Tax=Panagrolaimus sp. PS1159 TaxID=55785 RepID=A0AC35G9B3_9BILA